MQLKLKKTVQTPPAVLLATAKEYVVKEVGTLTFHDNFA